MGDRRVAPAWELKSGQRLISPPEQKPRASAGPGLCGIAALTRFVKPYEPTWIKRAVKGCAPAEAACHDVDISARL